ncbi:MAG: murein L,D-transpeptidase [Beijerinckiaceae bacterium]
MEPLVIKASSFSRRGLLGGLSIATMVAAAPGVFAAPGAGAFGDQAEWAQRYDADARLTVPRSTTPILSAQTLAATEGAIQQYQRIVAGGGWGILPNTTLKIGSNGAAVVALRRRLVGSGDLDAEAGASPVFDSYVEAGVKRFQARHGLGETGVVSQQTLVALNIPADVRLRQLETNLVRLRSFSGNLGHRYVTANIPAAHVETVEDGMVVTHHAAGVGKIDRQSPVMQAKVLDINFNPFWTVPASIIRKDLIPKMQKDPNYLTDNKIRIISKDGNEVSPRQINWNSLEATNYKFRQDPGADMNSLGFVRINIANPYGVYMHDTPAKGIFGDDFRFVSSGCMRVQNVKDYVTWLLKDTPGWPREKIDEAIRSGERIDAKLAQPVPVYWVYITAWATPEGIVQFREDIYQKDGFGPVAAVAPQAAQPVGYQEQAPGQYPPREYAPRDYAPPGRGGALQPMSDDD